LDSKEQSEIILGWIKWNLNQDINGLVESDLYKSFRNELRNKICDFINSKQFRNIAYEFAEHAFNENEKQNKTAKQVLPIGFENSLKVLIYNKSPEITMTIKNYINNVKFKNMLKNEINKFLVNLNPMVAKFVNGDNIQVKLMSSLNSYFDSPENIMSIVTLLNDKIDETSNKPLRQITDYMPYEGKNSMIKATVDSILDLCKNAEFIKRVGYQIDNNILSYGTIKKLLKNIGLKDDKLLDTMQKNINEYLS
jgi:uncharacterized membrane protein YheB (UPF0754 family)